MVNPLNTFRDMMVDFHIYRSGRLVLTAKGLKNTEKGSNKKYIGFYPEVDVQIGDVLSMDNSSVKYYVIDVDTATYSGEIYQIKAYYQNTEPVQSQTSSTVFNIENASNSIIGSQTSAIINNSNFSIDDLKQLIELYGNDDKEQLYELSEQLQQLLKQDTLHKGKLAKFSDLIAKHSWLPVAIIQLLSVYLQSH